LLQVWPAVQAAHATPPTPHAEVDAPAWHVPVASMHPVHAWQEPEPEQTSPFWQAAHVAPPVPHTVRFWLANGTQVLPTQQPLAQVLPVQGGPPVQAPLVQVWPLSHGMQAAPAVETEPH
jgi:hypothetical protein